MRLFFLPEAIADLETIGDYIARDNPRRAASFVAELRRQCGKIAGNPVGYRLRPELAEGIRSCAYGNYVIFSCSRATSCRSSGYCMAPWTWRLTSRSHRNSEACSSHRIQPQRRVGAWFDQNYMVGPAWQAPDNHQPGCLQYLDPIVGGIPRETPFREGAPGQGHARYTAFGGKPGERQSKMQGLAALCSRRNLGQPVVTNRAR